MACEEQRAALVPLQAKLAALKKSLAGDPKQEGEIVRNADGAIVHTGSGQAALNAIGAQILAATIALNDCEAALLPQRVAGAQAAEILQTAFQNPAIPAQNPASAGKDVFWGKTIAGPPLPILGSTFPYKDLEWKQVLGDGANEYDTQPVGCTGWAIAQDIASGDMPGLHPFGNDWEFYCALDTQYRFLLNLSNKTLHTDTSELTALGVPAGTIAEVADNGFLGVEWESGLVPATFQHEFKDGDRVAVFGRWIVDCGHSDFHSEIHPPLLLASASVYKQPLTALSGVEGRAQYTRALFTSRAYLPSQTFTHSNDKNPSDIYEDSSSGEYFNVHIISQVGEVTNLPFPTSSQVEAHPKIKQNPFLLPAGERFEIVVKTSEAQPDALHHLAVSFHFTVRSGCSVQVVPATSDGSAVSVIITMNSTGYTPPPLPVRNDVTVSLDQLNEEIGPSPAEAAGEAIVAALTALFDPVGAYFLSHNGFQTDLYSPLPVPDFISTTPDTVTQAAVDSIPAGKGVTVDNSAGQPYPVSGWVEVGWVRSALVVKPTQAAVLETKTTVVAK